MLLATSCPHTRFDTLDLYGAASSSSWLGLLGWDVGGPRMHPGITVTRFWDCWFPVIPVGTGWHQTPAGFRWSIPISFLTGDGDFRVGCGSFQSGSRDTSDVGQGCCWPPIIPIGTWWHHSTQSWVYMEHPVGFIWGIPISLLTGDGCFGVGYGMHPWDAVGCPSSL